MQVVQCKGREGPFWVLLFVQSNYYVQYGNCNLVPKILQRGRAESPALQYKLHEMYLTLPCLTEVGLRVC